ncbi:alginate lyase family protein [Priestia megaterium]|uniref:alginate lyase family protein n=1 Tax=Priestia megaterium TaxID=1404 RepID=UPI000BFC9D53|nr:alginate lyase family protein [Priestia megaterium]PGQ81641.1 hypothetical protein COA18_15560 [Priestia megaterium]
MKHLNTLGIYILVIILIIMNFSTFSNEVKELNTNVVGIHSQQQINMTKKYIKEKKEPYYSAYYQLLSIADRALDNNIVPNRSLYIPPTYEDGKGHNEASKYLMSNAYDSYALALAWRLSNNEKYAKAAIKILDSWAYVNKDLSKRFDTPLVMAYGGVGFIYAASLLSNYEDWNQFHFRSWVQSVYIPNILVLEDRNNNQGSWGNLAALASFEYLQENKKFKEEITRTKYLINIQINSTGILSKEVERGKDGMVYTYFSLAPLTQSMYLIYNVTGQNLFDVNTIEGEKIKRALDSFYVYASNQQKWPFYHGADLNNPSMVVPHNWPANLYEAMSTIYPSYYERLTVGYRPILGGYIRDRNQPSHLAWNFPSLLPPFKESGRLNATK